MHHKYLLSDNKGCTGGMRGWRKEILFKSIYGPGWFGLLDWMPACEPRGHRFDSQSRHMPGLWDRPPVGGVWEATTHWCFSPSLSLFLPLCLKINKYIFKKKAFMVPRKETICIWPMATVVEMKRTGKVQELRRRETWQGLTKPRFPTGMNEDSVPFTEKKEYRKRRRGCFNMLN